MTLFLAILSIEGEIRGNTDCLYVYHLNALFLLKVFQRMSVNVVLL